jgi:hypothetical protein
LLRKEEVWKDRGRTDAPLSVVSEDCVRVTEREELFTRLGFFVHIRMELLAQLQKKKKKQNKKLGSVDLFRHFCDRERGIKQKCLQ